ncbi:MAG: efflux RND transporter periplasmic adaptor subunit [Saprospiraceae bacterium]|nr:efflux RND transporter periplasmic adaptor subunit [Saprospiraceae bacterium]
MKRTKTLAVILFAIIVILGLGCSTKDKPDETASSPPAPVSKGITVDVFVAVESKLENIINATGSLLSNELVQIAPDRSGKLIQLNFNESSYVKEGSLLAKIDDEELKAQLAKQKVQETMAIREEERAQELRKIDAIPQDEFERLQNAREQIQADIKITQVQIAKTGVRAPFSGIVGLRNLSLGAYVSPSQSIVELQQTNPLKLEFDIPEKFMQQIKVGQKVTFSIVGFEKPFDATIYATSTEITPSTRSFKVRARCANPAGTLKPGNFAKVEVITGVNEHAIMLPSDAVVPVIDGQKVFVIKEGKVDERNVATGDRKNTMIEIISGIQPGDTVIVSGLLSISQNMPVQAGQVIDYNTHLN